MLYEERDNMYSQNQQRLISRSQHLHSGGSFSSQSVMTAVQDFVLAVNTMNETIMVPSRLLDMDMTNSQNKPVPELLRGETDPYAVYGMLNATKNDLMYGLPTLDDDDMLQSSSRLHDSSSDRWSSPCDSSSSDTVSIAGNLSNTSSSSSNTNPATQSSAPHNTTNNTTRSNSSSNINNNNGNSNKTVVEKQQPTRRESTLSMVSVVSSSGSDCGSGPESDITEESPDGGADEVDSALGTDSSTPSSTTTSSPASVAQASAHLRGHLMGLYGCLTQLSKTAAYITDRYQEEINE